MPDSKGKKYFRVQLSISIVLILITLSTLSLFAAFYLGMIAGKSMQRPPEMPVSEGKLSIEKPMSEAELKFFGLGERKKDQDLLDLEGIRDLKNKTDQLTKAPTTKETVLPKTPKTEVPKVITPKIAKQEPQKVNKSKITIHKASPPKISDNKRGKNSDFKTGGGLFTIQVFASRNRKNANALVEKLEKDGFNDAFIFKHSAGKKTLFRVRVGKVKRAETKILANKLKKLKYIDSVQVTPF